MNLPLFAQNGLPRNGLIAYYDPGRQIAMGLQGQTLIDYSGRSNAAQLGSAAGADTNDPAFNGHGLVFGADDYCNAGHPASMEFGAGDFTIIITFSKLTNASWGWIVNKSTNPTCFTIAVDDLMHLRMSMGTWFSESIPSTVITSNPHIVVVARRSGVIYEYLDGVKMGNGTSNEYDMSGLSSFDWQIGAKGVDYSTGLTIYNAAFYNRGLSDQEAHRSYAYIHRLMNSRGVIIA